MICQTIKEGTECSLMSKGGCKYIDGACKPIVANCEGCNKVVTVAAGNYCMVYPEPAGKWAYGICSLASHIKKEVKETVQKINPLKASKRANKKK
ncbi:MAG: PxxKW family cysteine-rich protein [Deltaproteobacteria bacterium]|nr:PxxKW family cysteine-rich protein [Deltaproteobacteria bacterium]